MNTTVDDSSFSGNQAGFSGGAIEVDQPFGATTLPELSVTGSSFIGNQAGYTGGAISTIVRGGQRGRQLVLEQSGRRRLESPWGPGGCDQRPDHSF